MIGSTPNASKNRRAFSRGKVGIRKTRTPTFRKRRANSGSAHSDNTVARPATYQKDLRHTTPRLPWRPRDQPTGFSSFSLVISLKINRNRSTSKRTPAPIPDRVPGKANSCLRAPELQFSGVKTLAGSSRKSLPNEPGGVRSRVRRPRRCANSSSCGASIGGTRTMVAREAARDKPRRLPLPSLHSEIFRRRKEPFAATLFAPDHPSGGGPGVW